MTAALRLGFVLATAMLVAGCTSPPAGGTLVIAGGGLDANQARVYARFLQHASTGPILILPQASGVPIRSAAAVTQRLHAIDPDVATVLDTDAMGTCGGVWLTGGNQSRIAQAFLPPTGDGQMVASMQEMLDRGGVIGSTSAGAAVMSDPMIVGGRSDEALAGGSMPLRSGFGVFPYGLVDQHFLRRGRLGRLVVALEQAGVSHGFGIEEDGAIIVDLQSHRIEVIGSGGLLFVDNSMMQHDDSGRRGLRVSWYADGAIVDARTGALFVASSEASAKRAPILRDEPLPASQDVVVIDGDPWANGRIAQALTMFQSGGDTGPCVVEVRGETRLVRLSLDARSSRVPGASTSSPPSLLGVRLDFDLAP